MAPSIFIVPPSKNLSVARKSRETRSGDCMLALAGRVSSDLSAIIREHPRALAALLRTTKGLTSDDLARLAHQAQREKDK